MFIAVEATDLERNGPERGPHYKMPGKRSLSEFFYFDETAIDGFANQLSEHRLDTLTVSKGKSKELSGSAKSKIALPAILHAFGFPAFSVDGGASVKRALDDKNEEKYSATREGRYIKVVDHLGGRKKLRRPIEQIWHKTLSGRSAYCILEMEFRPSYSGEDWIERANDAQFLQISSAEDPDLRVGMSFSKLLGVRNDRISRESHLAIRLRNRAELSVFGTMDRTKYVKPYVAFWISG